MKHIFKRTISVLLSLALILNVFGPLISVPTAYAAASEKESTTDAVNSQSLDYTQLETDITDSVAIAGDAKTYIKCAVKQYIESNENLKTELNNLENTLLFFFEGGSSVGDGDYTGNRNNAVLLMVAGDGNGNPKLISSSPYFSTLPDDILAIGCYVKKYYVNDEGNPKASYGPGTLVDGIYRFGFLENPYKGTGCKAYLLFDTQSVYLTDKGYQSMVSTDILIHARYGSYLTADRENKDDGAFSIGCLTGDSRSAEEASDKSVAENYVNCYNKLFADVMDPQNGSGYVIVNRILFEDDLKDDWLSDAKYHDAVDKIIEYSQKNVPMTIVNNSDLNSAPEEGGDDSVQGGSNPAPEPNGDNTTPTVTPSGSDSEVSELNIAPTKASYTIQQGEKCSIGGKITSNYDLIEVVASLNGKPYKTITSFRNHTSFDMGGTSGINSFDKNELLLGANTLTITAKDSSGKSKLTTIIITVNPASTLNIAPTKTSYTIQQGRSCNIGGKITSNYDLIEVVATLDGTTYKTIKSFSKPKECNIGDVKGLNSFRPEKLSVGTHKIKITATDVSGKSKTTTITITVKVASTLNIAPTKTSYTITQGENCSIGGTISSNYYLKEVVASLNGKPYKTITSFRNHTSFNMGGTSGINSFDAKKLPVGTHTLTITAKDSIGESKSTTIKIKVNPASTLNIAPTKTSYTIQKGKRCSIGGKITSNYNLKKVVATLDGTTYKTLNSFSKPKECNIGDVNGLNSFKAASLSVGKHTLIITAEDARGRIKTATITITVKAKSTTNQTNSNSTLQIAPTKTSYTITQGNSCSIGGTITSNYNLKKVEGKLDGNTYKIITSFSKPKECNIGDVSGLNSFKGAALSVGKHTLKITAEDAGGIIKTATITITVKAKSTTNQTNFNSTLQIAPTKTSYTITQGNSCSIGGTITSNYNLKKVEGKLDGNTYKIITSFSKPKECNIGDVSGLNSFKGAALSVGKHTLKITAEDAGGIIKTATITITVKAKSTTNQTNSNSTLQIAPTKTSYTITQGNSCSIGGTITSNYNLKKVEGKLDGNTYKIITSFSKPKECNIGDVSGLNSFKGAALSVGEHTLKITAEDAGGKIKTATITITVR